MYKRPTHNPFRAVLLCVDGYMVIWDYKNSPFLSTFNPLVNEQRFGADLFYFDRGDKVDIASNTFANEVRLLLIHIRRFRRIECGTHLCLTTR